MPKQDLTILELIAATIWMTLTYTMIHEVCHALAFWSLGIPVYIKWNMTYPLFYPVSETLRFYVGGAGGIGCAIWLLFGNLWEEDEEDFVIRLGIISWQSIYGFVEGLAIAIDPDNMSLFLNYGTTLSIMVFSVIVITYLSRNRDRITPMDATQ